MTIKIPRYIANGVVQYNGWLFDPDTMNDAMRDAVNSKNFVVHEYKEDNKCSIIKEEFELHAKIGYLNDFNDEFIFVDTLEEYEFNFKNPVALISILAGDCIEQDDCTIYKVVEITNIEIVEEDEMMKPRKI
jgi:hypothetical protein